ncbi:protein NETWORKED 3C-like [Mangifera indica]|uniref:protein NETWORKED 3C-like n=1 Tax=Mangifera indica TaxID=29780 RepID=UPI001CFAD154|nr:protein NETWORKED 3C-like [Mangifera indica]XP_044492391.1 protein NETWORKED 3C-like [Mangifera indica]XP_044492392.1 protein NETWORKED 3C-like [Mangifera indica]
MVEMMEKKETSHWWWFDSHKSSNRSPWLQTTIAELDEKTKAMLKLIEADADSFSKRAEMFYKKRPELICMVEDFYRAYRSLAERHDQVKSETGTRVLATFGSLFSSIKHKPQEPSSVMGQTYYSYSETSDTEDYAESEVENPEQEGDTEIENETDVEDPEVENETEVDEEIKEDEYSELELEIQEPKKAAVSSEFHNDEIRMFREEIQRLKEENKMLEGQLTQKDEEKREVIRQLSLTVGVLKEENMKLRKYTAARGFKKSSPFEFNKLKEGFLGKLFSGSSKSRGSVFPL